MLRGAILGTGKFVPERIVSNADLSAIMGMPTDWIEPMTGIVERRYIDFAKDGTTGCEMGAHAAKHALEMAGVTADDVDFLIWGTLSPDNQFPGNAAWAMPQMGLKPGTPAMDIRNQCSFVPYALTVADALIRTGQYKNILIVGSEIHSTGLEFNERGKEVAVLFGDGAGALLVGPARSAHQGILGTDLHADGAGAKYLQIGFGSATEERWFNQGVLDRGDHFPKMNGKIVFRNAVSKMPQTVRAVLQKTQLDLADIDLFIAHQANLRIVEFVQKTLQLPDAKVFNNIQRYGNTTAASILIALDECVRSERLKAGQLLCVAAFGAGFTWGSALIRW